MDKGDSTASRLYSIDRVSDEIAAGDDELSERAAERRGDFFLNPTAEMLPALQTVSAWATGQQYEAAAVGTFLQVADYYLVAHALAHEHTVVTHEVASISVKKIKIPNACIGLGIRCITPFEMLRRERIRFILEPQS